MAEIVRLRAKVRTGNRQPAENSGTVAACFNPRNIVTERASLTTVPAWLFPSNGQFTINRHNTHNQVLSANAWFRHSSEQRKVLSRSLKGIIRPRFEEATFRNAFERVISEIEQEMMGLDSSCIQYAPI